MRWAVAVTCVLAGCSEPATQLVVVVRSDIAELTRTRIRVYDLGEPDDTRGEQGAPFETPGISFGVVPRKNDPSRRIRIEVCGYPASAAPCGAAGADPPLVCQTARTGFIEGRSLRLDMFLARACSAMTCPEDQTCIDGACRSDERPAASLPLARPGAELGDPGPPGADAGREDAGSRCDPTCALGLIAAGGFHTCALSPDGTARCWGSNVAGELGDGTMVDRTLPVPVSTLVDATQVAVGGGPYAAGHTCALGSAGGVHCWGNNMYGQLGNGRTDSSATPVPVTGLDTTQVALGGRHSCALMLNGTARCWGLNGNGQLGNGTVSFFPNGPQAVLGVADAVHLSAGGGYSCAVLDDGSTRCWGHNVAGQLGDGTTTDRSRAVVVVGLGDATQVVCGALHTCAVQRGGAVSCWGANDRGQLGDGTTNARTTPVPVPGLAGVRALALGRAHSCALRNDGIASCWGSNESGQIGDGTTTDRATPIAVPGLTNALAIATGEAHSCALLGDGRLVCWGYNVAGQLGDGTTDNRLTPTPVVFP